MGIAQGSKENKDYSMDTQDYEFNNRVNVHKLDIIVENTRRYNIGQRGEWYELCS